MKKLFDCAVNADILGFATRRDRWWERTESVIAHYASARKLNVNSGENKFYAHNISSRSRTCGFRFLSVSQPVLRQINFDIKKLSPYRWDMKQLNFILLSTFRVNTRYIHLLEKTSHDKPSLIFSSRLAQKFILRELAQLICTWTLQVRTNNRLSLIFMIVALLQKFIIVSL